MGRKLWRYIVWIESENILFQDTELELKRQLGPGANCSVSQNMMYLKLTKIITV